MYRPLLLSVVLLAVHVSAGGTNQMSAKDLATARKIYVAKCAKCHRFYEPKEYSETDWRTWMDKMNQKSKLKSDQADLLKRYLDAYRAGQVPGKPEDRPRVSRGETGSR